MRKKAISAVLEGLLRLVGNSSKLKDWFEGILKYPYRAFAVLAARACCYGNYTCSVTLASHISSWASAGPVTEGDLNSESELKFCPYVLKNSHPVYVRIC